MAVAEPDISADAAQIAAAESEGMPAPTATPPGLVATPEGNHRMAGAARRAGLVVAAAVVAGLAMTGTGLLLRRMRRQSPALGPAARVRNGIVRGWRAVDARAHA